MVHSADSFFAHPLVQEVLMTKLIMYYVELKQISEISGYPFQIHYPDTGFELFRIAANYFKQL